LKRLCGKRVRKASKSATLLLVLIACQDESSASIGGVATAGSGRGSISRSRWRDAGRETGFAGVAAGAERNGSGVAEGADRNPSGD
jgi:hypothetical protein